MRWVRYQHDSGPRVGLLDGDEVRGLDPDVDLLDLLGDAGGRLTDAARRARRQPVEVVSVESVHLGAPLPRPPSIRDFYAFEQHVRTAREARGFEMDPDWYELPVFYFTNPHVVAGPGDLVAVPPECERLDYELEVAAVMREGGTDLTPEEAEARIAGLLVMNDWSARDVQAREMRQGLGPAKGKDFATSLGPALVTMDELAEYRSAKAFDLTMTARVNGVEYSRGNLADLQWSFGEMIAYASRGSRVEAGDVIGSGTVGTGCILELTLVHGDDAFPWLQPGDEVELTVDELGSLENRVVAGA